MSYDQYLLVPFGSFFLDTLWCNKLYQSVVIHMSPSTRPKAGRGPPLKERWFTAAMVNQLRSIHNELSKQATCCIVY